MSRLVNAAQCAARDFGLDPAPLSTNYSFNMSQIDDELPEPEKFPTGERWNNDCASIDEMLDWLESDEKTQAMLRALRSNVPDESLVSGARGLRLPPKTSQPDDAPLCGLRLMERCEMSNTSVLWFLAAKFSVGSDIPTCQANDCTDSAMDQSIEPFLEYIDGVLLRKDENLSSADAARLFSTKMFSNAFRDEFAKTFETINDISVFCRAPQANDAWLTVGTMCLQALHAYVSELRTNNLIELAWDFKTGDSKGLFEQLTRTVDTSGKFASTLVALIAGVWDHTHSILGRQLKTRVQALRGYLWTSLTLMEIDALIRLQP